MSLASRIDDAIIGLFNDLKEDDEDKDETNIRLLRLSLESWIRESVNGRGRSVVSASVLGYVEIYQDTREKNLPRNRRNNPVRPSE